MTAPALNLRRIILVVEDADECAAALEIGLQALNGFELRFVRTAEDALRVAEGCQLSAVVTDLHLPEMDGFELLECLRRDPRFASIPILVTSGDSDPATPDRATRLGANGFFAKPYSLSAVRRRLEELLHVR